MHYILRNEKSEYLVRKGWSDYRDGKYFPDVWSSNPNEAVTISDRQTAACYFRNVDGNNDLVKVKIVVTRNVILE